MPTIQGTDLFSHNNFTVPGGGPYGAVTGTPQRDTTIVRPGDPASLLISTGATSENVRYDLSPTSNFGWLGFGWYVTTTDKAAMTGAAKGMVQMWTTGFGVAAKLGYQYFSNELYLDVGGVSFPKRTVTVDAWHWVEMIYQANSTTFTLAARLDGVSFTSDTLAGQVSTQVQYIELGSFFDAVTWRYSHVMWGSAASLTDWLGEPSSGQTLLPDADVVTTGWTTAPLYSKVNDSSDATIITATAS